MSKMSRDELCRALDAFMESFKGLTPYNKQESKQIKFGVDVMKQAQRAIKEGGKAIELLKEFAFYPVEDTVNEHCERALKVQEFLKTTSAKEWIEEQIRDGGCQLCENYDDCEISSGSSNKAKSLV